MSLFDVRYSQTRPAYHFLDRFLPQTFTAMHTLLNIVGVVIDFIVVSIIYVVVVVIVVIESVVVAGVRRNAGRWFSEQTESLRRSCHARRPPRR